jgi:hypothetical protein
MKEKPLPPKPPEAMTTAQFGSQLPPGWPAPNMANGTHNGHGITPTPETGTTARPYPEPARKP